MRIRLKSPDRYREVRLEYKGIIEIHVQVFAICFDITFSGVHEPIHAEIILFWIDVF
jgi:hypothetical protein